MWCFVDHYSGVILDISTEVMFHQFHNFIYEQREFRNCLVHLHNIYGFI